MNIDFLADLPLCIQHPRTLFRKDSQLHRILLKDHSFWAAIGCIFPEYEKDNIPQFKALVNDKREDEVELGLQVEQHTANFDARNQDLFKVHLLLTVMTQYQNRLHRCVPIVSLYRRCPDGWYRQSLQNDIDSMFHKKKLIDWSIYK